MNRFRTIAMAAIAGFVLVACGPAASGNESQAGAASQAAQGSGGAGPSFGEGIVAEFVGPGELLIQTRNLAALAGLLKPFFPSQSGGGGGFSLGQ